MANALPIFPTRPDLPARAIQHDPLVCGIDADGSCPACRAAFDPPTPPLGLWDRLCRRFPRLAQLTGAGLLSDRVPRPRPDDGLLLALVALLADDDHRAILMAALAADIASIVQAAGPGGRR